MIEGSELLKMCLQKEMNRSACPFPGQQVTQEKKGWQSLTILRRATWEGLATPRQGAMEEIQRVGSSNQLREKKGRAVQSAGGNI